MQDPSDRLIDSPSRAALGKLADRARLLVDPGSALRLILRDLVRRGADAATRLRMVASLSLVFGKTAIEGELHRPSANDH